MISVLNQNDKIERFAEVINKNAQAQCKEIEKRAKKFKQEQLSALESQAKHELNSRLSFELDRISSEYNGEISRMQNESKQKIAAKRDEISGKVFKSAKQRLISFSETEAYADFLKNSVKNLTDNIDGEIIIFAKEKDFAIVKPIADNFKQIIDIRVDSNIEIGGLCASSKDEAVFANDTLDNRLIMQKEWFMANSGLSIKD